MKKQEYAYLTMVTKGKPEKHFSLDATTENSVGRGSDCAISLPDPVCSRVHAILYCENELWTIRDAGSRNGTFVDGEKTHEKNLSAGTIIRVGETELTFHTSAEPITAVNELGWTQTLVMNEAVSESNVAALAALPDAEQVQELMLLYQLSIKLLGCDQPDEVVLSALELLRERTSAAVVGFLWLNDEVKLVPRIVLPAGAEEFMELSASLTDLVIEQGRAIWIANQSGSGKPEESEQYADAVCAPLIHRVAGEKSKTIGAIHVYLQDGRFRQSEFDFTISLANIVAVALVRAQRMSALQSDYQRLASSEPSQEEMVGNSPEMLELKEKIQKLAKARGAVLTRGESGTGKELVARALHRASARSDNAMICVNCAAFPPELMESQLFGHKKGAFTGADNDHIGVFQQADMGTLFLDEIGELPLAGQAKLLRVLEGHPFHAVGSTEEITTDVRLIAATNQNLQKYVKEGKFREDLYYRLSVFELKIPPLRERGEDIALLIDVFLKHFKKLHARPDLKISKKAMDLLLNYAWPGNVRQLRNVIDSAVVLADGTSIDVDAIGLRDAGVQELETLRLEDWEKKLIKEALKRTKGSVPEAATLLGLGRATLYRRLEQYGIEK